MKEAIRKLKKGKSAGHDNITGEMLQNLGEKGIRVLTKICNKAWSEGKIPRDWEIGIILPIFKKGDKRECKNYRGITLSSIPLKVYERLLETRLIHETDQYLEQTQSGFRKNRSVNDHVFTIKQSVEKVLATNSELYQLYIDLEKAFDKVPWTVIEISLRQWNLPNILIRAVMSLYRENKVYIRTMNMESNVFNINEGLRQGGVLSPILFNLIMDLITKQTRNETINFHVGHRNLFPVWLRECMFADDLVLFGKNETDLGKNLKVWEEKLKNINMKINVEKTKLMVSGKTKIQTNLQLDGKPIEQVENFQYLGITINREGHQEPEINKRIQKATQLYHSLKHTFIGKKEISINTKMSIYKSVYIPVLTYGSETWVLTKRLKSRLQAMEMIYLRRVLGVSRKDRIRNEIIRNRLEVIPLIKTIERNQLRWFGHMTRMDETRPVKQIWETKRQGRRSRGRPQRTWDQEMAYILSTRGKTRSEAQIMAKDRGQWRKFINLI